MRTGDPEKVGSIDSFKKMQVDILARTGDPDWETFMQRVGQDQQRIEATARANQRNAIRQEYLPSLDQTIETYKLRGTQEQRETQKAALRAIASRIKAWPIQGRNASLVLYGEDHGAGKTHLSVAYASAILNQPKLYPVAWYRSDVLIGIIIANRGAEEPLPEKVLKSALVVVDDVDKADMGGYRYEQALSALYLCVDYLYQANRPIVLTTNLSRPDFEERFGNAITDRLPAAWWINIKGPSGRGGQT